MFYTKYRPRKFSEISKPNIIAEALMTQVKSKKTVHAYLFVGPRGIGKTTSARILAKALNCTDIAKNGDPCDKCENCINLNAQRFLDLIEIDAASNRGIDDIRELRSKVTLAPSIGTKKIYIIDEVHMLTTEAFNALLKTLEEPPKHVVFILCTTEFHKVPDTIKSRCQVFKFRRATKKQIASKLKTICDAENITNLTDEDLLKVAEASFGGFRDAETMLQQIVEGNLDIKSFIGLSSKQLYVEFVDALVSNNTQDAFRQINKVVEDGLDLNVWVLDLLNYLRDLLFVSTDAHEGLVDAPVAIIKNMQKQVKEINYLEITKMLEAFMQAENELETTSVISLPLELAVVKLTRPQASSSPSFDDLGDFDDPPEFENVNISKDHENKNDEGSVSGYDKDTSETQEKNKTKNKTKSKAETKTKAQTFDISTFLAKWPLIIKETVQYNNSIHALLKACDPVVIKGRTLILEVGYAFHKDRLEAPKNRNLVEKVIKEVFGNDLNIKCEVSDAKKNAKKLTDKNVTAPAFLATDTKDINEIFDGALPL